MLEQPTGPDDSSRPGEVNVVLKNVAELAARRRARELGTTLALQLFRLIRVGQFHALDNMAVIQQLEQTVEAITAFSTQSHEPLSLLFSRGTVFVSGQLLKASRAEYEAALELGSMVEALGLSELIIAPEVNADDLRELVRIFQPGAKPEVEDGRLCPAPTIRLRRVESALLRDEDELSPEEQVLRSYASCVVVMRRIFDNLARGRYELPHQAKRLAQRLVSLSEGDAPAFLGVTAVRTLNHDAAGRAVNRAILAVCMGRQVTDDLAALSRIAMAGLFLDAAQPLLSGLTALPEGAPQIALQLSEEQQQKLPASTALVLTALGHLRPASMVRSVIAYEAHWLRLRALLGEPYGGARKATAAARIVATAHRFNELMSPDLVASRQATPDEVIAWLRYEARDGTDHAMIALLIGALGIFPSGTAVELSSGERGVVLQSPESPVDFVRPTVQLVIDPQGRTVEPPVAVDLRLDGSRQVVSVVHEPDERLQHVAREVARYQLEEAAASGVPSSRDRASDPPLALTVRPSPVEPPLSEPPPSSVSSVSSSRSAVSSARNYVPGPVRPAAPRKSEPPGMEAPSPPDSPDSSPPSTPWSRSRQADPPSSTTVGGVRQGSIVLADASRVPTATGTLERTPVSQLLLYFRQRQLSGSLVFSERTAQGVVQHGAYFQAGGLSKLVLQDGASSLGEALVECGVLESSQLYADPLTQPPTDDALLESEVLELALAIEMDLVDVRARQLAQRARRLFSLPPECGYAFFADTDLVSPRWGRIGGRLELVPALLEALREQPELEATERTLGRTRTGSVRLVATAPLDAFAMLPAERAVADALVPGASLAELLTRHDERIVRIVLYVLLSTGNATIAAIDSQPPSE